MSSGSADHEHAQGLLPWIANGTLEGAERARVERHVRACLACRAELDELRAFGRLIRAQPPLYLSAEGAFERLSRRIDEQPQPRPLPAVRRARIAAAACLAVATVAGIAGLALQSARAPETSDYRTLAEPAGNDLIDVIFAADLTDAQMRTLLAEHRAVIVAGPSPRVGRYTIRPVRGGDEGDLGELIERLNADERIRFAGRAYSRPDSRAPAGEPVPDPAPGPER